VLIGLFLAAASAAGGCSGKTRANVGDPCVNNTDCADQICHLGICGSNNAKDNGSTCRNNGECKSFLCLGSTCAQNSRKAGEACRHGEECQSKACLSLKCSGGNGPDSGVDAALLDAGKSDSVKGDGSPADSNKGADSGAQYLLDKKPIAISTAKDDQQEPAVAYNYTAKKYLVVWTDLRAGKTAPQIYGAIYKADGSLSRAEFSISTATDERSNPAVASDGSNFLVVWQDKRSTKDYDIYGAVVDPTGKVIHKDKIICSVSADQTRPVIDTDGTDYLVVWEDERTSGTTAKDIYGRLVNGSGVVQGAEIEVTKALKDQAVPRIVASGTKTFMVVWTHWISGVNQDIHGVRVDTSGKVLDSSELVFVNHTASQINPALVYDGTDVVALWEDYRWGSTTFMGNKYYSSKGQLGGSFTIIQGKNLMQTPAAAFISIRHILVWTDHRTSPIDSDIYGIGLGINGSYANTPQFVVSAAKGDQQHPAAAHGQGKTALVVWQDRRSSSSWDIYGARVQVTP